MADGYRKTVAMKKIGLILTTAIAAILLVAGCKKGPEKPASGDGTFTGTWQMVSWSSTTAAEVYVEFAEDGAFDLYQRVYSPYYEHFSGTWNADGNVLSGKYSDGTSWSGTYTGTFSDEGSLMTLTRTDSPEDVATYRKGTIPDEVLSGDLTAKSGRPAPDSGFRFL